MADETVVVESETPEADGEAQDGNAGNTNDSIGEEAIRELAIEVGWNPDHDGSDGKPFVDARTYLRNANVIAQKQKRTIDKLQSNIDEIRRDIKTTMELQGKVAAKQIDDLRKQLTAARKDAILEADVARVEELDAEIDKLEDAGVDAKTASAQANDDPEFNDFLDRNSWYGEDEVYTAYADRVADKYAAKVKSGAMTYGDMLLRVEEEVKVAMEKKGNGTQVATKQQKPATKPAGGNSTAVAGAQRTGSTKTRKTINDLPDLARDIARRSVRRGEFKSEQEYVDAFFAYPGMEVK